jgi:hypothetical protein
MNGNNSIDTFEDFEAPLDASALVEPDSSSVSSDALDLYELDVQEASQTLGVSLARLSQLTTKGTLSHVRRRVGARWRVFYRRDEIDELARVNRAVVYQRPPSYVPLPLTPAAERLGDAASGAKARCHEEARPGASVNENSGLNEDSRPQPAFGTSFGTSFGTFAPDSHTVFVSPPYSPSPARSANIGYGKDKTSALSLEQKRVEGCDAKRRELLLEDAVSRLASLERGLESLAAADRARALGLLGAGRERPPSSLATSSLRSALGPLPVTSREVLSDEVPSPVALRPRAARRRSEPTRVRYCK